MADPDDTRSDMHDVHSCGHLERPVRVCSAPLPRSGRHHRARVMWRIDRCPDCGLIHCGWHDGDRGDVGDSRASSYLTARRLSATASTGLRPERRVDANSIVLLAGVVLLLVTPCLGWVVLV